MAHTFQATILVPYVAGMLRPETKKWAEGYADAQLVELDRNDDAAYFNLLAHWWQQPGDLIVVEQDIVPRQCGIERMAFCQKSMWCTERYPIEHHTMLDNGLGCVRFSQRLKERWPGVMVRVGYIDNDGEPAKSWRRLDTRVSLVLHQLGYKPHVHSTAQHLHDYK